MKIYISGKITGLPFPEVEAKFQSAEELLEELDLVPVNPLRNGLTKTHSWDEHIIRDVGILLRCDGILMLDNWESSDGAMIERYIAEKKGMDIWHELPVKEKQEFVSNVKTAVYETTGLSFREYTTASRKREFVFARMLFTKQCSLIMKPMEIAGLIKRDRTTVLHLLKVYKDDVKYNPIFRELAQKVDNILNQKA
jgi:hypothetical protein